MSNQNVDLKRAGLKVTLPRLNILSILSESADEERTSVLKMFTSDCVMRVMMLD